MNGKVYAIITVVAVLALASVAGAEVEMKFDCGVCGIGWLQPGWISIPQCGYYEDVNGTVVDVNIVSGGDPGGCDCRGYFDEGTENCEAACPAEGPLAGVEQEFLMRDDCGPDSTCGDMTLVFSDLDPGAPYTVKSYHNRLDEPTILISGVTVTGASDVTAPATIAQEHETFANNTPAIVTFTAGEGDVAVTYFHPTADCGSKGCQVFLNGFILEGGYCEVQFESASSSALESVSPANLVVNLSDPQDEQVTVYYSVTGGTATEGGDYTIPAGPLVFDPGQTTKTIPITIANDGADEQDETIEVTLSSASGGVVILGAVTTHTYTILDPRVAVGFETAASIGIEDSGQVEVTVELSAASPDTISVHYAATGGTATSPADYTVEPNTLTFAPGETEKTFNVTLVSDGEEENPETIVLTLDSAVNAKFGIKRHTCTVFDPWRDVSFELLKVDLGCPSDPATLKEDWTAWEVQEGCDGQPHYGVPISNIAGTNIDAYISPVGDAGNGNLRKMEYGEAICNTFYSRFSNSDTGVAVELTFSGDGLTAGEYWLYTYHNTFNPNSIPSITVTGDGVIQKEAVLDTVIQAALLDEELVPSLVRFMTNGSGPVTITYSAAPASNAVVNAFELRSTVRPVIASNPNPPDQANYVDPNIVLTWQHGKWATSHNVYFGTDFDAVSSATTASDEFIGNQALANKSYDPPGLLQFATTYYWRIDESADGGGWQGETWSFTTDNGKARKPIPRDGGRGLAEGALLTWIIAPHATSHDVYLGTDFNDVNDADTSSPQYAGNVLDTAYEPGLLDVGRTYYWRVDEVGAGTFVKGDVWTFEAAPRIDLSVDFALPLYGSVDYSTPWPESVKPGWMVWAQPRWHDMYGHDFVKFDNIGGAGVDVGITNVYEGRGGLKMAGLEMCSLNASGCPEGPKVSGTPLYDPICNTWFQVTDYPGPPGSNILLPIYGLPPGEYALIGYHNRYKGERNGGQPHWECICGVNCTCEQELPMTSIEAFALAAARNLYETSDYAWSAFAAGYDIGSRDSVEMIQGAYNVEIQQVTTDEELIPSIIKFSTDGSPVLVIYTGTCCVPDDIRPARQSGRAILNAFRLVLLEDALLAYAPIPADGEANVLPDVTLGWAAGLEAASHDVYFGTDSEDVANADTSTAGIYRGRQASTEYDPPEALGLGNTYYWRVDEVNDVNIWAGNVWSFSIDAGQAGEPSPADGASEIQPDAALSWSAGIAAGSHDVYFGTDYEAVRDADTSSDEYKGNQPLGSESYDPPGVLLLGKTYFWRIDEVNPSYADSKGDVWSFATAAYIIFDDMESYCGDYGCGNEIYDTWRDGWENLTSSTIALGDVAFDPVHGGSQSMVYAYYNQFDPYYSEVDRDVGEPSNWAGLGLKAIVLYFYGSAGNSLERLYLGLEDVTGSDSYSEVVYSESADLAVEDWHEWNVSLEDLAAGGVDLTDANRIYIGFGDRDNPSAGDYGSVAIDDILLYAYKCVLPGPTGDLTDDCIVDYKDVALMSAAWLSAGGDADLYPDGVVDFKDYCVLAGNWLADNLWP